MNAKIKNAISKLQDNVMLEISKAVEGETSFLDASIILKEIEKMLDDTKEIVKSFKDDYRDNITEEAAKYNNLYKGFKFTLVNGRRQYKYVDIPEINEKEKALKDEQAKFKAAFDGFQKRIQPTIKNEEGVIMWVDDFGEAHFFPQYEETKSYIKIETKK